MQETPRDILEWTEIDRTTGNRILKEDAPEEVRQKAIEFEKEFFRKTARRRITNIEI